MKMWKVLGIVLIAGVLVTFGSDMGQQLFTSKTQGVVPSAEARVGRPLTPVSVAGVGRRTVRRCAAGVYNCKLTEPRSLEKEAGHETAGRFIAMVQH